MRRVGQRIGMLSPRDTFLLNEYPDERYTRCPRCRHRTYPRKVPLLLHVHGHGPLVLGKTGPYCAGCRLVITHRLELEAELADAFSRRAPEVIGNEYLVLGTVEVRAWRRGMAKAATLDDMLRHTAEFKAYLTVERTRGGWGPVDR